MVWECLKWGMRYEFAPDEDCVKFLSWKEEDGTYFIYLLFTYFIDFLSYLSYQIKWYEHKSLWTYFVTYTDYSAKGVLLDWLATICIIIIFLIVISFIPTITTFE